MRSSTAVAARCSARLLACALLLIPGACSDSGGDDGTGTTDDVSGSADVADAAADANEAPDDDTTAPPDTLPTPDADASATKDPGTTPPDEGPVDLPGDGLVIDPLEYTFSYVSPLPGPLQTQVTVTNAGEEDATITGIGWTEGSSEDFTLTLTPTTPKVLPPGETMTLDVEFQEVDHGVGILRLTTDQSDQGVVDVVFDSYAKVTADDPDAPCVAMDPPTLAFGPVERGTTKTLSATLRNCSDTDPLVLEEVTRSKIVFVTLTEEFQLAPEPEVPQEIPPGGSLPVKVSYSPLLAGADSGYFGFHLDSEEQDFTALNVSGVGKAPSPDNVALTIRLSWDSNLCDVDSHLIAPEGEVFDCQTDCYFSNPSPDWGVEGEWQDDPFLDVDDVDGYGPEHINISSPQPGKYVFVVHYWRDNYEGSPSVSTNATVEVLSYGETLATFGPQDLDVTDRAWQAFQITWPEATVVGPGHTYMATKPVNLCVPDNPF
ncbi:MAG: YfaP family protein [Myxococcota bacterium]